RVRRYAEALAARGDQVDVIALKSKRDVKHYTFNGVNVYGLQERVYNEKNIGDYIVRNLLFFIRAIVFNFRMHLRNKYNLIHVHNAPDFLAFTAFLPRLA